VYTSIDRCICSASLAGGSGPKAKLVDPELFDTKIQRGSRQTQSREARCAETRPFSMMNTIVMTGGTSGLGEVAARRFIQTPQ
jgi:hypothetical protein